MTNEQALSILQQIAEQVSMPLVGHKQAQEALRVLAEAIKEKDDSPEDKE